MITNKMKIKFNMFKLRLYNRIDNKNNIKIVEV